MEMMQSELLSNPHSGGLSGLASLDTKNELLNQLRSLWSIGQETVHKLFFKVLKSLSKTFELERFNFIP